MWFYYVVSIRSDFHPTMDRGADRYLDTMVNTSAILVGLNRKSGLVLTFNFLGRLYNTPKSKSLYILPDQTYSLSRRNIACFKHKHLFKNLTFSSHSYF